MNKMKGICHHANEHLDMMVNEIRTDTFISVTDFLLALCKCRQFSS